MPVSVPLTLALPLALTLALILIALRVPAEIPFTAPLFPVVSRVVRVVGCIIHSIFLPDSLVLPGSERGNLGVGQACSGLE